MHGIGKRNVETFPENRQLSLHHPVTGLSRVQS